LVGLWTAAVISFIFVKTPTRIWDFIVRQCTTSLTIDNSTYAYNLENFNAFLLWFQKHRFVKFSRSFTFDPTWEETQENLKDSRIILGAGEGKHFFTFNGRFFWLTREKRNTTGNSNNNMQAYEIHINMFGRSQKKLLELVEAFRYRYPKDKVGIYRTTRGGEWNRVADAQKRSLSTVFLDYDIKRTILADIEWFLNNRDWYTSRGIPYKLTFMFWGPPGSGKSSLIKAIASYLNRGVALINLSEMSDSMLEQAFATSPKDTVLAIEDFDATPATRTRGRLAQSEKDKRGKLDAPKPANDAPQLKSVSDAPDENDSLASVLTGLTLSGFLNALDGLVPLDGQIIFLTSNKVDHLDEAVTREGRMDRKIFLGELQDPVIRDFFMMLYPEYSRPALDMYYVDRLAPIMGAKLYGLFGKHKHDPKAFLDELPKLP